MDLEILSKYCRQDNNRRHAGTNEGIKKKVEVDSVEKLFSPNSLFVIHLLGMYKACVDKFTRLD
jgi:hypothetical protein